MGQEIPVFLINLARRPDRLETMAVRLQGTPFERVDAIDGQELSSTELAAYTGGNGEPAISISEAACALSHRKIWKQLLSEDIASACIIEDDVLLSDEFPKLMKDDEWLPDGFDLIKLETMKVKVYLARDIVSQAGERELRFLNSFHGGTGAYIVSRGGAEALLDATHSIERPIDNMIFETARKRGAVDVMQVVPAPCMQDMLSPDGGSVSDIATDRSLEPVEEKPRGLKKILREGGRPIRQLADTGRRVTNRRMVVPFI